jgi:hypothetical protein
MNFYHFLSSSQIHGLMRGATLRPLATLCPTPNLISHGGLTLYGRYGRPLAFRLSVSDFEGNPDGTVFFKMAFEEGKPNRFTLKLMSKREESQFLKDGCPPKGFAHVFWLPKAWEASHNKPLVGATLTLGMDSLAKVFQNNLIQVIDARRPHNAELYPTAASKLEPAHNIYAYAGVYLRGYRRWMERMKAPQTLILMDRNARADLASEEALLLALEDVTCKLGKLVELYQQGQIPKGLEETLVQDVAALPRGKLKRSYL